MQQITLKDVTKLLKELDDVKKEIGESIKKFHKIEDQCFKHAPEFWLNQKFNQANMAIKLASTHGLIHGYLVKLMKKYNI